MENNAFDSIPEDLFYVFRLFYRKLLRTDVGVGSSDTSFPHFAIMRVLDESGLLPVSEIGKRLMIPKPQMTHFVDKLLKLGLVERLPDTKDRRIINVTLTEEGRIVLAERKESIGTNIRKKLSCLQNDEVEKLSASLRILRNIGEKIK